MIDYKIKIVGAQYAANPDYKFGDPETPEICARTIGLLSAIRDMRPRVVLKAEPTNPRDEKAVMARAMGRKIGYVCKEERDLVRSILNQSERHMLMAEVSEVVINKHGYLYILVHCKEAVDIRPLEPDIDWSVWQTDIPMLPPTEAMQAEEEAVFVLEDELLPRLEEVDITELQTYLGIWMEGSRHDLSSEASEQRELYIKLLEAVERDEVHDLASELKHQCTGMCSRHRLEERTHEWWPSLVNSDEAEMMWSRWMDQTKGELWGGLKVIDDLLRQLPGGLYQDMGHMEVIFSRMYYLRIPREALMAILSLLVLREKTCKELGIAMKPMTEDEYACCLPETNNLSMKDMAKAFMKFPAKIALGMFGGVSTLLAGHPAWQKSAPKIQEQILAKEEKEKTPTVKADHYYASGSHHDDHSHHLSLETDNDAQKLLE